MKLNQLLTSTQKVFFYAFFLVSVSVSWSIAHANEGLNADAAAARLPTGNVLFKKSAIEAVIRGIIQKAISNKFTGTLTDDTFNFTTGEIKTEVSLPPDLPARPALEIKNLQGPFQVSASPFQVHAKLPNESLGLEVTNPASNIFKIQASLTIPALTMSSSSLKVNVPKGLFPQAFTLEATPVTFGLDERLKPIRIELVMTATLTTSGAKFALDSWNMNLDDQNPPKLKLDVKNLRVNQAPLNLKIDGLHVNTTFAIAWLEENILPGILKTLIKTIKKQIESLETKIEALEPWTYKFDGANPVISATQSNQACVNGAIQAAKKAFGHNPTLNPDEPQPAGDGVYKLVLYDGGQQYTVSVTMRNKSGTCKSTDTTLDISNLFKQLKVQFIPTFLEYIALKEVYNAQAASQVCFGPTFGTECITEIVRASTINMNDFKKISSLDNVGFILSESWFQNIVNSGAFQKTFEKWFKILVNNKGIMLSEKGGLKIHFHPATREIAVVINIKINISKTGTEWWELGPWFAGWIENMNVLTLRDWKLSVKKLGAGEHIYFPLELAYRVFSIANSEAHPGSQNINYRLRYPFDEQGGLVVNTHHYYSNLNKMTEAIRPKLLEQTYQALKDGLDEKGHFNIGSGGKGSQIRFRTHAIEVTNNRALLFTGGLSN